MILTFDPDKPHGCPECGENREEWQDYRIDSDGIWHFSCFSCGADWKAKAKRSKEK